MGFDPWWYVTSLKTMASYCPQRWSGAVTASALRCVYGIPARVSGWEADGEGKIDDKTSKSELI